MEADYTVDSLRNDPVLAQFLALCAHPRQSHHEGPAGEYLLEWGKKRGLEAIQDAFGNVLLRKPASLGCAGAPGVLLQAHMDMVCEKAPGVEHDFARDPIVPVIEGDLLTTGGRTTLGADNGIGVAYALALLEDDSLRHPALEVLLTTAEEEDMSGALRFDSTSLRSHYLINLDHAVEKEILCGSCGGIAAKLVLPVERRPFPSGWATYRITLAGLQGGHSGEDIDRGRGNANILLARFLQALAGSGIRFALLEMLGGSFRLAIPRDAGCVLAVHPEDRETLVRFVLEQEAMLRTVYAVAAPSLCLSAEDGGEPGPVLENAALERVLSLLLLSPNGISERNGAGGVESSDNLGELRLHEAELELVYEIRAAFLASREFLQEKLRLLAALFGAALSFYADYPGWPYQAVSPLRDTACRVYREQFCEEPHLTTVHAGLECGCFADKRPDLDMISLGPDMWNFHSPSECASIPSVRKTWGFLRALVQTLADS